MVDMQTSETQRLSRGDGRVAESSCAGEAACARVLCDMRCLVAITFLFLGVFVSIIVVGVTSAARLRNVDPDLSWIVLDTDMGTDDAYALGLLLEAEKRYYDPNTGTGPRVLAVTCVNGNTNVDNVVVNVLKVLNMTGRLDGSVAVYRGAAKGLLKTNAVTDYFGADGMGDVAGVPAPSADHVASTHAAVALVDMANKYPGKISLLAIGPLTNIAMAIRIDEEFLLKLKHLLILGGSTEGRGNKVPGAEFNFWMDPEANYVVLKDTAYENDSVSLLSWEQVEKMRIAQSWRVEQLGALQSPLMQFLNKAEDISSSDAEWWEYCDPVAAAILLRPTLALARDRHAIVPYTQGEARGGIAVDYYDVLRQPSVTLYTAVQIDSYKSMLLDFFQ